jgi:quercetin 2,3-dioxygenase
LSTGDSLGNKGKMTAGDLQWMTAGIGILHQEMPKGNSRGRMHGFQLWANLSANLKMTDPRYQDIPASAIPEINDDDETRVRVICGKFWGKREYLRSLSRGGSEYQETKKCLRQPKVMSASSGSAR